MKALVIIFFFTISLNLFSQSAKEHSNKNTVNIETEIYNLVSALPEVKERAAYVKKESKGTRNIRVMIYRTPKETFQEYYWIKVVEDNEMSYVSHFNFYVYPENLDIKFYDTINDTVLSLREWRKINKSAQ